MIFKMNKNSILTAFTWVIISGSLFAVGMNFISCSREISQIVQGQQDEQINELIALQANMPPVSIPLPERPAILQRKFKDSILTYYRPQVSPCGADSGRATSNGGGVINLHCGGEAVGSLFIKPNAISKDTTIQVTSYSLAVMGLDVHEYSFSPDGLQFSQKSELKLSGDLFKKSDGTPADEIVWLYLNPRTEKWELQSIVSRFPDGYFHIELSHFSLYRAVTRSGISISQGGQVKPNVN